MICQQFFLRKIYRAGVPRGTLRSSKGTKKQFCFIQNRRNFRNLLTSAIFCARICPKGNNASAHGTVRAAPYASQDPKKSFGDLLRGIFLSFIIHDSFILCQAFFRSFFGRLKGAFHFLKLNIPKIGLFFPLKDTIRRQFMHRKHAVTSAIGWSGKSRCKAVFPVGYANDGIKSVMIFTDPSTVRSSGIRKEYYPALRTRSECYQKFVLQASDNTLNFLDAI